MNKTDELSKILAGNNVVVSAYNPGWSNPNIYNDSMAGAKAIQETVKKSGVIRFITIGGMGSLYIAPNVQLIDTPEFPKEIFDGANTAREYLNIIKEEKDLDWFFFSPAIELHQGTKTERTENTVWDWKILFSTMNNEAFCRWKIWPLS